MSNRKKIALVIGWGSVKCTAALGLLRVLSREGIEVSMVVVCGGGSMYGSMFALGHDIEEIVAMNQRLWTQEVTEKTNRLAVLQLLLPKIFRVREYFNLRDDSLVNQNLRDDSLVNQRLRDAFGDKTFADTKIPLLITATEYKTGEQVVISEGSIYEAVRASISLPLIFPPIEKDEHLLADGFLSDPLPIGVALKEGADIVLAMGFGSVSTAERKNFSDYMVHVSGILSNNLMEASYAFYNLAHHSEVIMLVPEFKEEVHMFDTHKVPDIIHAGEMEGEKILPRLKSMLEMPSE